jgi:hypothetical protein
LIACIFDKSSRYFDGEMPELLSIHKKVGVFVQARSNFWMKAEITIYKLMPITRMSRLLFCIDLKENKGKE